MGMYILLKIDQDLRELAIHCYLDHRSMKGYADQEAIYQTKALCRIVFILWFHIGIHS